MANRAYKSKNWRVTFAVSFDRNNRIINPRPVLISIDNLALPINDEMWERITSAQQMDFLDFSRIILTDAQRQRADELGLNLSNEDMWHELQNLIRSIPSGDTLLAELEEMTSEEDDKLLEMLAKGLDE